MAAHMNAQFDMFDAPVATVEAPRTAKNKVIRRKDLSHSIIDCHRIEDALWSELTQLGCDEYSKALQIDQALMQIECPPWCELEAWDRIAETFRTWSTTFGNLQLFWQLRWKRDDER
jgi:hypothetical protein